MRTLEDAVIIVRRAYPNIDVEVLPVYEAPQFHNLSSIDRQVWEALGGFGRGSAFHQAIQVFPYGPNRERLRWALFHELGHVLNADGPSFGLSKRGLVERERAAWERAEHELSTLGIPLDASYHLVKRIALSTYEAL